MYIFPFVPLLLVLGYGVYCETKVQKKRELVEMTTFRMTRPMMEKQNYESFLVQYPQEKHFDIEQFFISFPLFSEKIQTLSSLPEHGPWKKDLENLRNQRVGFKIGKKVMVGPYSFEEKILTPALKMNGSDLVQFLEKIENPASDGKKELGAGELFFTQFSFQKKGSVLGDYYKVRATVMEKRGLE
ncbi:MAG: hypothetical protein ACOYK9_04685 [Chlamydiia bacterium]